MTKAEKARNEIGAVERLAAGDSPIHRISPLAGLFLTILFIAVTVSFHKYNITSLIVMVIVPVLGYFISGIPLSTCFIKLRIVMPLVCALGLINPFLDKNIIMRIGSVNISGGVISMITLMLKGIFCLMMSFLFIATNPIDEICAGLRKIHFPKLLVSLFLLTYRYIAVLLGEVAVMTEAYQLRSPGQRGVKKAAWGSFLGQLLIRSMDKAQNLYDSMSLRGFNGEFYMVSRKQYSAWSWPAAILTGAFIIAVRVFDIAGLIGSVFVR